MYLSMIALFYRDSIELKEKKNGIWGEGETLTATADE